MIVFLFSSIQLQSHIKLLGESEFDNTQIFQKLSWKIINSFLGSVLLLQLHNKSDIKEIWPTLPRSSVCM